MKIKDNKRFHGGMNTDDNPANLPDGDYVGMLNTRTLSSAEQHGSGIAESLQAELEILINPSSLITYYGNSIGGAFVYSGFNEVTIGTQTWMKKNYDGAYPGSKVYDDVEGNADIYGRLYTHNQITQADFCPDGWRVPTEADIDTLLTYLGGAAIAGGKLKETGEQHWTDPNTGASDVAGFRAVAGGKFDLLFDLLGDNCLLWLLDEGVPVAPVAIAATGQNVTSFMANWAEVEGVTGYYLDVATDAAFTAPVAGYPNKNVGKVLSYTVTGLAALTPYYYRVRAYNEIGSSANSNTITKTTLDGVVDADGNVYTYVTIGTQQWMAENFRSTKYRDGTPIPNLTLDADWIAEDGTPGHDGAYCYYNNDIANKADYGALYNWPAVNHGNVVAGADLAPAGWKVPTTADINTFLTYLGGGTIAGGKLKEMGIGHWLTPNTGATDKYGYKALPAGYRTQAGSFLSIGESAWIWRSVSGDAGQIIYNGITYTPWNGRNPKDGYSVRMMRDVP